LIWNAATPMVPAPSGARRGALFHFSTANPAVAEAVAPERRHLKRRLRHARRKHAVGQRENLHRQFLFLRQTHPKFWREPINGHDHHDIEHRCAHRGMKKWPRALSIPIITAVRQTRIM